MPQKDKLLENENVVRYLNSMSVNEEQPEHIEDSIEDEDFS